MNARSAVLIAFFPMVFGCRADHIPEPAILRTDAVPAAGDAYVTASIGDASYLNPLLASDSASGDICSLVYNGLVKYDKDLKLVGDLAESWEVRNGGKEILFHLRENVLWHDGVPFTAEDVEFTYKRLIDPAVKTPFGADFQIVKGVDILNPHTLKVTYSEPFAPALESWGMGIVPKHVFKEGDFNSHPANRRPVGTGPYRFIEWKTDEKIVLRANPDYFEGPPSIQRYIYRIIPDSSVQFLELRHQSIDAMGLTPDQYKAYPEFFQRYQKFRYPSFSYTFLGFNLNHPFFRDRRVRQALAHALNKDEIIEGVLLGFGRPATGPFPPTSWAYNKNVADTPYDPAKAKTLLRADGWLDTDGDGWLDKNGQRFEFTIITNQGNKMRELSAVILQNHFARIGVKVNIRILEWSSFIHNYVDKRQFDAILLGWSLSRDPDQFVIWHSSQRGEGRYNLVGYASTKADALLEAGRREFDMKKREEIYHRLHALLAEDQPYIFLYYPEALPTIHKRFVGPEVAPAGIGWNFWKWYVPEPLQKYHYAS
ncbi:MAG: peptide-binding protein [Elusimicrobia bacterium]|nr:peptide-binding protein [Elusimicrobiota bacterium]